MKLIPDGVVDMSFADLPYGTTRCACDSRIDLDYFWRQNDRVLKRDGAALFTAQIPFSIILGASNLNNLKYGMIWEKSQATGHLNAKRQPMRAHEDVLVFYREAPAYFPQKTHGHPRKVSSAAHKERTASNQSPLYGASADFKDYDSTERYPRSVLRFASDKQHCALHPLQKPVGLLEYLILTYTRPGEIVLDPSMGSATTAIACLRTGRRFIGIELDKDFFAIAQKRVQEELILMGS